MSKEIILRDVLMIILGLAFIIMPDVVPLYSIVIVGAALMIIGLVSLIGILWDRRAGGPKRNASLVTVIACMAFGLILVLKPMFFVNAMMYILGFIAVFGGGFQIYALLAAKDRGAVFSGGLFVVPALILIAGVVMLFNPFGSAKAIVIMFGVAAVLFGIIDMYNSYIMNKEFKDILKNQ